MKLFPMNDISAHRVESNIPIDTTETWSSSKTYKAWDKVKYGRLIYQSLSENNTAPPYIDTKWNEVGISNEYAYLDGVLSNQSVSNSTLYVKHNLLADTNTIAIGGLCGDTATVIVRNAGGGIVSTDTFNINSKKPDEMAWWQWTYPQPKGTGTPQTSFVKHITPATGQTVEVRVTPLLGKACLGILAYGATVWLGCTLEDIRREIRGSVSVNLLRNNQRKVKERKGYIKLILNVRMMDETTKKRTLTEIDTIQKVLEQYINVPIGIFGDDTGDSYSLRIYGIYDRVESSISPRGTYNIILDSLQDITK